MSLALEEGNEHTHTLSTLVFLQQARRTQSGDLSLSVGAIVASVVCGSDGGGGSCWDDENIKKAFLAMCRRELSVETKNTHTAAV